MKKLARDPLEPIKAEEAVRPLSVGLFLAVFLPTTAAAGGCLLTLLFRSFDQSAYLGRVEENTKAIEDQVKALGADSKQVLQKELPELQKQLALLAQRLDQSAASPSAPKPQ